MPDRCEIETSPRRAYLIKLEEHELAQTPRGKRICPLCCTAGWPGWWDRHRRIPHVECVCGKVFAETGLAIHKRACRA